METKQPLTVVGEEQQCDGNKFQDNSTGVNHSEKSEEELQSLRAKIGECEVIVHAICNHLPKLLFVRLVNKKWDYIASKILRGRSNIWIRLYKPLRGNDEELESWKNVNPASRNNSKLTALDRLLAANSNFPCQNYWVSVGIQGSSGSPSSFIVKWIDRIKSLHFDVLKIPFPLVHANFMAITGFVAVQNVQNLQIEHGPYDWGLPPNLVSSNVPRLDRLKKLTLGGNYICDQNSWRDILREAVSLERIHNCTFPFLPEIVNQNKTSLVKSILLNFVLKSNPAYGLTLEQNVHIFAEAVRQGLQLEEILAFDIDVFISPQTRAECTCHQEPLPPQATLTKWYQILVHAFNRLLKKSEGTLNGVQNMSCLGFPSRDSAHGGCQTHIQIPRMTKLREIDWYTLRNNPLMRLDLLLPLANDNFLASRCFPNVTDISCDLSKQCWTDLAGKSSSDLEQLTRKLSMPSASVLYWYCSYLDFIGYNFINRNRDCDLIQHLIHPMFPNLVELDLHSLKLCQFSHTLTKIFQFFSGTLQKLSMTNRNDEVAQQSHSEMWCLDAPITGLPGSFLNILRENSKNVQAKTVQLLRTRPSIRSMKCLKKLSFYWFAPHYCHGHNIPLISELSQLYGFEYLPKLKTVSIDCIDNPNSSSDEDEEQQEENDDTTTAASYYRRYRYYQRPKKNVNQSLESLENEQFMEQQVNVELQFLKETIEEKLKPLKNNSTTFKELKSVLHDVTCLLNNF